MTSVLETTTTAVDAERGARWPEPLAAVATALSAALVLWRLGEVSFWHDEAFSVGVVDRPFGDALWRMAHWEVNQSPFLLVLAGWWRIGESEWFLRLLPAAATVAAVPAVFHLGRRIADARTGAIAAALLAIHPQMLEWGQQLRGYSLVVLLVVVSTTLLLRAAEYPEDRRRAVVYAVVAAIATYTHFYAGLVVTVHGVWLVVQRPVPGRLLATAGATYAALVAPLGQFLLTREGDPLHWVADTGLRDAVVDAAKELTGGTPAAVVAYGAAAAAGTWATAVRSPASLGRFGPLAVGWLVVPAVAVTAATATVKPLLEGRFLIVVVPALVLVAAAGLVALPRPAAAVLVTALVTVSVVGIDRWYDRPVGENWRQAAAFAAAAAEPGAIVVVEPWTGVFALRYYEDRLELEPFDVRRPGPLDPPTGTRLVEVRSLGPTGSRATLDEGYVAWRDAHYDRGSELHADGIVVTTYAPA